NKTALLEVVRNVLPSHVNCIYTRQPAPLGLGHAVLCAAQIVGNEPFAVLLADDLIDSRSSVTQQLVEAAHQHNGSVLAIQKISPEHTDRYGIISASAVNDRTTRVVVIVEKLVPANAPPALAVVGLYILDPEICEHLRKTQAGVGCEIQLPDGIAGL